jgi:ABC-type Na+ efflux pump permease subunit
LIPQNTLTPSLGGLLAVFPFLICPTMVVMMALDSFGRELASETFSNLLALPISRSRVWWTKILVLASGHAIVFGAWWLSFLTFQRHASLRISDQDLHAMMVATLLFIAAVFSGGVWSVLHPEGCRFCGGLADRRPRGL